MLRDMPGFRDRIAYCSLPLIKPTCIINDIALTLCKADVQFERIQYLCNVSQPHRKKKNFKKCFPLQG